MQKNLEVFCCYAREDHLLLLEMKKHLTALQRVFPITIWDDANISPGRDWEHEIKKHLDQAQIILLLISPDFMTSDYCYSKELQRAMERHERGEARVIPIILRPIYWQGTPFAKLQALPINAQPITSSSWSHLDEAFFHVVEGIRQAVEELSIASHEAPDINQDETFSELRARTRYSSRTSRKEPANFSRRASSRPLRRQRATYPTHMHHPQDNSLVDQQNALISQESPPYSAEYINTEPFSPSQAYETLRKTIEREAANDYEGAIVAKTSHNQLGEIVHLQMADRYRDGWDDDNRMEYARVQSYTVQGHTVAAAVFKGLLQGEYVLWINKRNTVASVVCSGEAILLELDQRKGISFSRPAKTRRAAKFFSKVSIFSIVICTLVGGILGYVYFQQTGMGLLIGFLFGLITMLLK